MNEPYFESGDVTLHHGNALTVSESLPSGSVQTIVTSPPYYGLRDYGETGQMGSESSLSEYIEGMVALFAELRRVLAEDGTLWLNIGDSYSATVTNNGGYSARSMLRGGNVSENEKGRRANDGARARKLEAVAGPKNLLGVPWRVALALQADGWILRSDIIWAKPNPMPESVTDRPTKSHEHLFLFTKNANYFYDAAAIAEVADEGTRNKRDVWTVATTPFPGSHFAVYPPELIRPCIRAGSRPGDTVLDPFSGSGTTGAVATFEGRKYIGIDLNKEYLDLSLRTRFAQPTLAWETT